MLPSTHFVGMFYGPGFCWLLRQRRAVEQTYKSLTFPLMFFFCVSNWWGNSTWGIFFALLFHIGLFFFLGKSEPRNRQKKSQRRIEGEEKPVTSRPDCQRHKLEFTQQHAIWKGSKKPQELGIKTGTIEKIITTYKSCLSSTSG